MKHLIFVSLTFLALFSFGQDTLSIYNSALVKIDSLHEDNFIYKIALESKTDENKTTEFTYYRSGQLLSEENFYKEKLNGKYKKWYENGQIQKDIDYKNDAYDGKILTFWENGKRKRVDKYEAGNLVIGQCYTSDGLEAIYKPYLIMPEYPGGLNALMKYLGENIKYPIEAKRNGIQGRVFINFVVETDGSITDIKILRGIGGGCDEEAIRVVEKMPKWTPGLVDGENVRVSYNLPIKFTLNY